MLQVAEVEKHSDFLPIVNALLCVRPSAHRGHLVLRQYLVLGGWCLSRKRRQVLRMNRQLGPIRVIQSEIGPYNRSCAEVVYGSFNDRLFGTTRLANLCLPRRRTRAATFRDNPGQDQRAGLPTTQPSFAVT